MQKKKKKAGMSNENKNIKKSFCVCNESMTGEKLYKC